MAHFLGGLQSAINLKQGYLYIKRERGSSHMPTLFKPWQQSYFVLRGHPFMLEEYKEASLKTLRQTVMLDPIKHVGPVRTSKSKEYAFQVVMEGRNPLLLACENVLLMNEWIRVFAELQADDGAMSSPTSSWAGASEEPVFRRPSSCEFPERDHLHGNQSEADDIRRSATLTRSSRSLGDQYSTFHDRNQHAVEKHTSGPERRARLPKTDTFYLTVVATPLARANFLQGSFLMKVANSRISLLDVASLEEKLSWPLSQVKNFSLLPREGHFCINTGRNCHFGHGKLMFESEQVGLIAKCIQHQLPREKHNRSMEERGLSPTSSTSSSEDDESDSDANSPSTLPARRTSGVGSHRLGSSAEAPDHLVVELPRSDGDLVFVPVSETAEMPGVFPSIYQQSIAAPQASEAQHAEVVEAPGGQWERSQDGYDSQLSISELVASSDPANYEYAMIDDLLPDDGACEIGTRGDDAYAIAEDLDAACEQGDAEQGAHSYLELTEDDVAAASRTETSLLLVAIENQLVQPTRAKSPLTSPTGLLSKHLVKSMSDSVPDSPPMVCTDNRRASEPLHNDIRHVQSRLEKICEHVSNDGYLQADDMRDACAALLASPQSPGSPRSVRKTVSAAAVAVSVRSFPTVKERSITKRSQSNQGPFTPAMAPFTRPKQYSISSKEGQQAFAEQLRMRRNKTEPVVSASPMPKLDRNKKPKHLLGLADAPAENHPRLAKVASFDISSELSSDDGGAGESGQPPPCLPRAPVSSPDGPKLFPSIGETRKRSAIRRAPKVQVDGHEQQHLSLPHGEGKQRSNSSPTLLNTTYPNLPAADFLAIPNTSLLPPPPLPPKSKLLSATKSAPSNRTSSQDHDNDFGDELLRTAFSSHDVLQLVEQAMPESDDQLRSIASDDSTYGSSKDVHAELKTDGTDSFDGPQSFPANGLMTNEGSVDDEYDEELPPLPATPLTRADRPSSEASPCSPAEVSPWLTASMPFLRSPLPDVVLRRSTLNDVDVTSSDANVTPVFNLPNSFGRKGDFPSCKKF